MESAATRARRRGNWRRVNNSLPNLMAFALKLPNRQGQGLGSHGVIDPVAKRPTEAPREAGGLQRMVVRYSAILTTFRVTVPRRKSGITACLSASSLASFFELDSTRSSTSAVALKRMVAVNVF